MLKNIYKLASTALLSVGLLTSAQAADVVVGGKSFTEQQLLTAMTTQYLKHKGYDVETRAGMGSSVIRRAQEDKQIDLYWEYTGTALTVYHKVKERMSPEDSYNKAKELDEPAGIVWLNPSKANNTYALAMRRADTEAKGIKSLSDLSKAMNDGGELSIAVNAAFYTRDDGLKPMQKEYGFKFPRSAIKRMDSGLTYTALKENQVDVALVFSTDGRIPAFDFVVLEDDKGFFPDYAIVPVVRKETLEKNPKLAEDMNTLSEKIDDTTMANLNAKVDVEKQSVEKVAEDFLKEMELVK